MDSFYSGKTYEAYLCILVDDVIFYLVGTDKMLRFCSYSRAKRRYSYNEEEKLSPGLHLAAAAEAGALVSVQN